MKGKKILSVVAACAVASSMCAALGCDGSTDEKPSYVPVNNYEYDIPQDYCRTYYEVFVRSFADGNGDGIGDFRGLIDSLDYLNDGDDSTMTDLGINGIWLMPFNQSPSYHKYDVEDYYDIDDEYGTLGDFDELVAECERRGIWLQMDLVLNHTSTSHKWFKQAIHDAKLGVNPEDSAAMSKYNIVRQDKAPSGSDAGTWYKMPGTTDYWYLGNFSSEMPDVNLANQDVRDEIKNIVDFWLERGIRSFRLDAVPWAFANDTIYNDENGEFWTWFNDYCNKKGKEVYGERNPDLTRYCYNVGEVWASGSVINKFFETGMSNFNYEMGSVTDRAFITVTNGSAAGAVSQFISTQKAALTADENAILSNFLSNHDNDRSVGFFGYDLKKVKMGAGFYLLCPGNPYIYYGEETGLPGSKGASKTDANRRLHFDWGEGDSRVTDDPPEANYSGKPQFGSCKEQAQNPDSILSYYRNAIALRNRFPEIGRGVMSAVTVDSDGKLVDGSGATSDYGKTIAAYTLNYKDKSMVIVHNFGDDVTLDASAFSSYNLAAELHADGGSVSYDNGTLKLSSGCVALLRK